jgi:hypothetical protein
MSQVTNDGFGTGDGQIKPMKSSEGNAPMDSRASVVSLRRVLHMGESKLKGKPETVWLIRNQDDKITEWYRADEMDKFLGEIQGILDDAKKDNAARSSYAYGYLEEIQELLKDE